jgi:predicted Zn finger-like uncharacterized protein
MVLRFSGARPEGTSMEVRCEKCQARYKVDDARIGPQGLTMRCGKCQNTFRVTRSSAPLTAPGPAKPESSTMMFAAPSMAKPAAAPAATRPPAAPLKPAVPRPGPAAAAPTAAAPTEGAGRTMMFQTGNLKTTPPGNKPVTAPTAKPKPAAPEDEARATMVFGQSPIAGPKSAAMQSKPAAARGAPGAAMMFGAGTGAAAAAKPAAVPAKPATQRPLPASKPAPAPEPEAAESEASTDENDAQAGEEANVKAEADQPAERVSGEGSIHAEGAKERAAEGAFDKAPPKGLLVGVAVGLAVLVLIGGGLVLWKKMGRHAPPPAAVETLASATSAADKDTMASLADAENKAKDALDVAGPKSHFPQAVATLARIEIQWSDALNEQASFWTDKGQKAAEAGNDAKKTEAEAKASELQNQGKARLKIAFETIAPAYKTDPKSPDLELALADYYRAQRSNSNMNKELRKAQALKTEEPRIALVQGLAAAQEEDGAEKAISKLKTALNANANSARIHFRLAMAYLAAKDNDNAMKELKETLRISPQHERAKLAMEQLAAAPAEQK